MFVQSLVFAQVLAVFAVDLFNGLFRSLLGNFVCEFRLGFPLGLCLEFRPALPFLLLLVKALLNNLVDAVSQTL